MRDMTIAFIGAGRVGTTLALGFARAGYAVVAAASRSAASAEAFAARVAGSRALATPQQAADAADLVFITVGDDAIAAVANGVRWREGTLAVHCSGAADLDVLGHASAAGARAGGFHPLQMFAEPEVTLTTLPGATVALAGDDDVIDQLEPLVRALGAKPLRLPPNSRALYHASANFAGAFAIALLQEAVAIWRSFGVAEADAIAALAPLLKGTLANVERLGTARALGSAVARGDVCTLEKHLAALAARAPQALPVYRLMSERTVPLALQQGGIDEATAARIVQLLRAPDAP
jgi:predicted short-subunit dehydrogenase-like oxidoreductase (DUF2520 family)